MSSNKRVKIYLKKENNILNFMWADTASDGSVMIGIYGKAFETSIEKIFAEEGELEPGKHFDNVDKDKLITNTKISFHQSGYFKLASKIKKDSIDRTTVKGSPLKEILIPTRMLEVLIPAQIEISANKPREGKDSVIDITKFPNKPLRCTVSCMPINKIEEFNNSKIVDTSIIESSCVFEYKDMAWGWTLRISKDDTKVHQSKFFIYIPGEIVWPK